MLVAKKAIANDCIIVRLSSIHVPPKKTIDAENGKYGTLNNDLYSWSLNTATKLRERLEDKGNALIGEKTEKERQGEANRK